MARTPAAIMRALAAFLAALTLTIALQAPATAAVYVYRGHSYHYRHHGHYYHYRYHGHYYNHRHCHWHHGRNVCRYR